MADKKLTIWRDPKAPGSLQAPKRFAGAHKIDVKKVVSYLKG